MPFPPIGRLWLNSSAEIDFLTVLPVLSAFRELSQPAQQDHRLIDSQDIEALRGRVTKVATPRWARGDIFLQSLAPCHAVLALHTHRVPLTYLLLPMCNFGFSCGPGSFIACVIRVKGIGVSAVA